MKTLCLLRHAKSSWGDPSLSDADRPLNKRGRGACKTIKAFMKRKKIAPDMVLCSPSKRTRETLRRVHKAWKEKPKISFPESLYLASPADMLSMVHTCNDRFNTLMLISHNPGMHALVSILPVPDAPARADWAVKFPTAALAVITFDIDHWADLDPGSGQVAHFVTPKGLGGP